MRNSLKLRKNYVKIYVEVTKRFRLFDHHQSVLTISFRLEAR